MGTNRLTLQKILHIITLIERKLNRGSDQRSALSIRNLRKIFLFHLWQYYKCYDILFFKTVVFTLMLCHLSNVVKMAVIPAEAGIQKN